MENKILQHAGFGGGCHWCTEAVFASLKGIAEVQQGWIASVKPFDNFSEAVLVKYDASLINLKTLMQVHVSTHAATSKHSMRYKYRSAVYYFNNDDKLHAEQILAELRTMFDKPLITLLLRFKNFKLNTENYRQYYHSNPGKPFCKAYIQPKINLLKTRFENLL